MKQRSHHNTLVGAVVGALPPFIGTFAQTGMLLDPATMLLASYIFTWQFPHFYGILYENKEDYAKAGFVMTSNLDPEGDKFAYNQMMACSVANTLIPCSMAYTGIIYPVVLIPFLAAQIKALQAVVQFKRDKASTYSAKHVKKT